MKNIIIGLGIFALVFSLNLFFQGSMEVKNTSPEGCFSLSESVSDSEPEQVEVKTGCIHFDAGVLQQKTETSHVDVVRKLPVALGLLFLLFNQDEETASTSLVVTNLHFKASKDLVVFLLNLRI